MDIVIIEVVKLYISYEIQLLLITALLNCAIIIILSLTCIIIMNLHIPNGQILKLVLGLHN